MLEIAASLASSQNPSDRDKADFIQAFDASLAVRRVKLAKLTMGLYWAFPKSFPPLDGNTREYISGKTEIEIPGKLSEVSGAKYLDLIDRLNDAIHGSNPPFVSFPNLSQLADVEVRIERNKARKRKKKSRDKAGTAGADSGESYDLRSIIEDGSFLSPEKLPTSISAELRSSADIGSARRT